jgi:uncharacterized protein (TIGR02246 family)
MNRYSFALFLVMSFLVLISCTQTQAPPAAQPDMHLADQKAISDGEVAWVAEWKSRDLEKIVGHYADDAIVMEAGMSAMKGKDAIRTGTKEFLSDKNFSLNFKPVNVQVAKGGDLAYSHGTFSATITDAKTKKPVTEIGKYVTVYRKTADGTWKAILDINNTDAPAR